MAYTWLCALCALVITLLTASVRASGYGDTGQGTRYGGRFQGRCDFDGMYYMDDSSFVMCSHSIAYIMPCAPGTRNSGRQLDTLTIGDDSGFSAFCDVNLVDIGYAAFFSQQAAQNGGGYGSTSGSTGYGSSGSTGYGSSASAGYGSSASTGYGASRPSTGYGASSVSSPSYGKTASYGSGSQGGYGQQGAGNIVITFQKQFAQTQRAAPTYGQMQKTGYSQQQKPKQTYGQASSGRTYGQMLGYGGGSQTRNTYSVGGLNSYGNVAPRKVAAPSYQG